MIKHLLAALALFICIFSGTLASAQTASFSYNDGVGTPNAGTYTPGSSFTFAINLAFTPGGSVANLEGFSYWFEQQNPSAPFNFAITNRDTTGSMFTDVQSSPSYPQNMTPQNANDLGALLPNGQSALGTGTYFVADLTISISASAAPGTYVIENTTTGGKTSQAFDSQGHGVAIPQATYTITVVPEPSSLGLLALGVSILGYRCRKFLAT